MTPIKKILIIKTSSLGDVIHCLPVINDIRAHFLNVEIDWQIDWIVEESFADILRLHTGISNVFTLASRRWRKQLFSQKTWAEMSAFKQKIKQNKYDAIIDTQGLLKSALITKQALAAKHGVKHGYDKNSIREPIASCFYDKTYNIAYQQHAVTRNRALCALSLGYKIPADLPNYGIEKHGIALKNDGSGSRIDIGLQSIDLKGFDLKGFDLKSDYVIALHGTSRDSKLWPVENWVNLGKELAKQNLSLVLPWAGDAELARANQIASQLNNASVLPKLSITELAGVIANAKAAIGVDTGLSHLAAALSIPTIAIYTDTNPALTGVMAGAFKPAINLGGIDKIPSVDNVIAGLNQLRN